MNKYDSIFCSSCTGKLCIMCGNQWGSTPSGYKKNTEIQIYPSETTEKSKAYLDLTDEEINELQSLMNDDN